MYEHKNVVVLCGVDVTIFFFHKYILLLHSGYTYLVS